MTTINVEELDSLYSAMRVDAINEGLFEDNAAEAMQPLMDKHFGGVSYKEVRDMVRDTYPERFI